MKIVVLAGGISSERDVSLSSGGMIYQALRKKGHAAILLDVYLGLPGDRYALKISFVIPLSIAIAELTKSVPV